MYKIERVYFNKLGVKRLIKTALTLEQAQAHCNNPETSSSTATGWYYWGLAVDSCPHCQGLQNRDEEYCAEHSEEGARLLALDKKANPENGTR